MMKDLNGWVSDRVEVDVTVTFGILGKVIMEEECLISVLKGGLCVGNMYFKHKSLYKYTGVARGKNKRK